MDQDGIDGGLLEIVPPSGLTREDPQRVFGCFVEKVGGRELVVDDHLRATEPPQAAERDQLRVPGPSADENYLTRRHRVALSAAPAPRPCVQPRPGFAALRPEPATTARRRGRFPPRGASAGP